MLKEFILGNEMSKYEPQTPPPPKKKRGWTKLLRGAEFKIQRLAIQVTEAEI